MDSDEISDMNGDENESSERQFIHSKIILSVAPENEICEDRAFSSKFPKQIRFVT
jgi:hypothetical protein